MLWTLVLPLKITAGVVVVAWAVWMFVADRLGVNRWKAFGIGLSGAVLGFIPLCAGVGELLDPFRFGVFQYAAHADIPNEHHARRLPPAATDLTVDQRPAGLHARLTIPRAKLERWLDQRWAAAKRYGHDEDPTPPEPADAAEFARHFGRYGWAMPADAVRLDGPVAPNGASVTVWYSDTAGVAFEQAAYW